jgi:hypothetical protein
VVIVSIQMLSNTGKQCENVNLNAAHEVVDKPNKPE